MVHRVVCRQGAFADTLEGVKPARSATIIEDARHLASDAPEARCPGRRGRRRACLYAATNGPPQLSEREATSMSAVLRGDVDGASIGFWPLEEFVSA